MSQECADYSETLKNIHSRWIDKECAFYKVYVFYVIALLWSYDLSSMNHYILCPKVKAL